MPKSESALKYFKRYSKFYLSSDELKVCWRVEATDWISMPGILEINAVEYYANEFEDDIENGVVGGLIADPVSPNTKSEEEVITGDTFIKPTKFDTFTVWVKLNRQITINMPFTFNISNISIFIL